MPDIFIGREVIIKFWLPVMTFQHPVQSKLILKPMYRADIIFRFLYRSVFFYVNGFI